MNNKKPSGQDRQIQHSLRRSERRRGLSRPARQYQHTLKRWEWQAGLLNAINRVVRRLGPWPAIFILVITGIAGFRWMSQYNSANDDIIRTENRAAMEANPRTMSNDLKHIIRVAQTNGMTHGHASLGFLPRGRYNDLGRLYRDSRKYLRRLQAMPKDHANPAYERTIELVSESLTRLPQPEQISGPIWHNNWPMICTLLGLFILSLYGPALQPRTNYRAWDFGRFNDEELVNHPHDDYRTPPALFYDDDSDDF